MSEALPLSDRYEVSTDSGRLYLVLIHRFLSEASYWARGIPRETVERAVRNSLCFGVFERSGGAQVGFARVVSDRATFAYLADVFVLPAHRGRGISKWLLVEILGQPDLQGLRRWMLATLDAHGLYAAFGFTPLEQPDRFMVRYVPGIYEKKPSADSAADGCGIP